MAGINLVKLAQIWQLIIQIGLPFIIVGDQNMTPDSWDQQNWLSRFDAVVLAPSGVTFTCNNGGRILDFVILSRPLTLAVKLVPEFRSPWPTHTGLTLAIYRRPRNIHANVLWVPRPFPHPINPTTHGGNGASSSTSASSPSTPWPTAGLVIQEGKKLQRRGAKLLYGTQAPPFQARTASSAKVSGSLSLWASKMEGFYINKYKIPQDQWSKH